MLGTAQAKPAKGTERKRKTREKLAEAKIALAVRAACVARDGHCLITSRLSRPIAVLLGPCEGPSEWAHIAEHRRCHTRGMEPEQRHTTAGSGMLCNRHHQAMYDKHLFDFLLGAEGMDGPLAVIRRAA